MAVAGRPAAMLLDGVAWEAVRTEILTGLGLAVTAGSTCGTWPARWMARGKEMAQRLAGAGAKASVQIVSAAQGRVQLSVGTPGTRSASRSH